MHLLVEIHKNQGTILSLEVKARVNHGRDRVETEHDMYCKIGQEILIDLLDETNQGQITNKKVFFNVIPSSEGTSIRPHSMVCICADNP